MNQYPIHCSVHAYLERTEEVLTLSHTAISRMEVAAYTVPTDLPESDGTFEWNSTTIVLVRVSGGGGVGLGYTYADTATATLVRDVLAGVVRGHNDTATT